MKTVFSNHELPHIWAGQKQQEGRAHSFYFNGKDIFSYGSHFCIARIVEHGTKQVVLITPRTYSNSTSKHINYTYQAVRHLEKISVPYPNGDLHETFKGSSNASYWLNTIQNLLADSNNTAMAVTIVGQIEEYLRVTKQSLSKKATWKQDEETRKLLIAAIAQAKEEITKEDFAIAANRIEKNRIAKEKREEKAKEAKLLKLVAGWIAGIENSDAIHGLKKVYLRAGNYTNDFTHVVQTSHGARVSYKGAKILFERIQQGKDVKGFDLDGYTVIGINGTLKIGCHEIERTEIERFAKSQNWI